MQCSHCENPGLLFAGLKRAGHIEADLDINMMIREALAGESDMEEDFLSQMSILQTGESKDKAVSYLRWDKVTVKRTKTDKDMQEVQRVSKTQKVGVAAGQMIDEYYAMKQHLVRDLQVKKFLKQVKEGVLDSDTEALVHVDWAENHKLKVKHIIYRSTIINAL